MPAWIIESPIYATQILLRWPNLYCCAHEKLLSPTCILNQILNYGLQKESFKLNLGFYHWEISSYLNNAVHLDVFVFALLCLLSM